MTFQVDSHIPLPKRAAGRHGTKYPFATMHVEQSFLVPGDVKAATIRSAVGAYAKRYPEGGKFAVRNTEEGIRVWRIE